MANKISLENIKIYAYHGVLPEENIIGTYYNIDIYLETNFWKSCLTDELYFTINYDDINNIIHKEMAIKSKLLENVSYRIIKTIFKQFDSITSIKMKISKLNPPIIGDVEKASVEMDLSREIFEKNK